MENNELKKIVTSVRGVELSLLAFNRSLELCSRMNYETENLDFIDEAGLNDVFYDIGACEGRFSLYAAKKGLKVYSFEPEMRNFNTFQKNIKLNALVEKINAFNCGVGSFSGSANMMVGQPWEGGHHKVVENDNIRQDMKFEVKENQIISIVALDDFIIEKNLPTPQRLKVDIDGSEMEFIKGAPRTLSNLNLKHLLFELDEADINFEIIMNSLASMNWKFVKKYQIPNEKSLYNYLFDRG